MITALFSNSVYAQKERNQRDEDRRLDVKDFIEKRNVYLTEKLSLTAEDAAKFLPLENELMTKKFEVGKECHELRRKIRNKENPSEEEYASLLKCREDVKAKHFELDKKYMEEFKVILSCEQILIYEKASKDFFDEYMKKNKK
jgi:hypothetical protein